VTTRRRRRLLLGGAGLLVAAVLAAWAAAWLVPLPARLDTPGSTEIRYRDGGQAWVDLSPDEQWRLPITMHDVDPRYVRALLRLEDKRFYEHPGIDPIAVARAAATDLAAGHVVSGASTITMQLVRLLEPRPRTLRSKAIEAAGAVQLELRLSKAQILAAYLTHVPYGRNLEGIEAASWAYFGHSAAHLDAAEIATLLAVPQNPNARYPCPDNAARLKAARDDIADRLLAEGAMPEGDAAAPRTPEAVLAQVKAAPVPTALRPLPREIPHAAAWLRRTHRDLVLDTTLDRGVQQRAEAVLGGYRKELELEGVHNAAVVVVDHDTAEIRALIGSFDFWDGTHGGQIAAFDVPRSPGSTLKPLIYARAVDRGMILPEQLRPDIPVHYGSYAPDNYDGTFDGLIRMKDALSRSRNVPFVNLLGEVGVEPFLGDLRQMGVRSLVPMPGYYGLSAAVGGIELTPLELAGLYTTLADNGVYRSLTAVPRSGPPRSRRIFDEGATWLTRRALRLKDRPDFPARRYLSSTPRRIFWKTGTSFGNKDAWAIGSGRRFTVVVWLGNVDQTPSSFLVGSRAAGPVLFDLLEALDDGAKGAQEPPTGDLVKVRVCALSGYLPTAACPHTTEVYALREHVPTQHCPYHVGIQVDTKTGQAVTPACRGSRETRFERFVLWPSAVRRWLDDRQRWQPSPPPWAPGCAPAADEPPKILSPDSSEVFVLLPGVPPDQQEIPLEASSTRADARVHWYVDGTWLGDADADQRLWWTPSPGVHDLVAMDERGKTRTVRVEVRDGPMARAPGG